MFENLTQASLSHFGARRTGLGLSICREILFAHFGQNRAENVHSGGGAFDLKLAIQCVQTNADPGSAFV